MGAEKFEQHYAELYGTRWPRLREALLCESVNERQPNGYSLDPASVIAAQALGVCPGETVLDLCAAPGGKTLILAQALGGKGRLVANERSSARRARLKTVLEEHLSPELREIIQITGHDATRWGMHEQNLYDRVLLDAPCSSERHLLHSPKHLAEWSPARSRQLAQRQYAMLVAGVTALKPGGQLVYSTCSLSPRENDDVIQRLIDKNRDWFRYRPSTGKSLEA